MYTSDHGNVRMAFPGDGITREMLSFMDEGMFHILTDDGEMVHGKPVEYWDPDELDVIEFVVKPRPFAPPQGADFIEYLKKKYSCND